MGVGFQWPEEALARLKTLFEQGKSDRDIARLLSEEFNMTVTRNAVIGKRYRLGLGPDEAEVSRRQTRAVRERNGAMAVKINHARVTNQPPRPRGIDSALAGSITRRIQASTMASDRARRS